MSTTTVGEWVRPVLFTSSITVGLHNSACPSFDGLYNIMCTIFDPRPTDEIHIIQINMMQGKGKTYIDN
jgi:hypothetical protein